MTICILFTQTTLELTGYNISAIACITVATRIHTTNSFMHICMKITMHV